MERRSLMIWKKAELSQSHFTEIFKPHNNSNNPAPSEDVEYFLLSPLQMNFPQKLLLKPKLNIIY